eukprot:4249942-Amphidinium_carterae.2
MRSSTLLRVTPSLLKSTKELAYIRKVGKREQTQSYARLLHFPNQVSPDGGVLTPTSSSDALSSYITRLPGLLPRQLFGVCIHTSSAHSNNITTDMSHMGMTLAKPCTTPLATRCNATSN